MLQICKNLWWVSKKFCRSKLSRQNNIIPYPWCLIPKRKYKSRLCIDSLLETQKLFIVRRSDKNHSETFNIFGTLRKDALTVKELPNLSMNLLGGKFKSKHLKFIPKGSSSNVWNGKDAIMLKDYENQYEIAQTSTPIFIEAGLLNNIQIPYNNAGREALKLAKLNKLDIDYSDPNLPKLNEKGISKISHQPTNLNYWHVELQIFNKNNDKIAKAKDMVGKSASEYILIHIISKKASSEIPSFYYPISKSHYIL